MTIDYSKAKILIVDDNPSNIDILLELLKDFDVRAALDGESALDAVKEELPDLILLDIIMPGLSGYDVCQRLQHNRHTKKIPVIFLSANADEASIVQGFEIGGVDYIKKPYLAPEVLMRVKTHLKLKMSLEYLEHLANVDELTGISNRRRFFKHANALFTHTNDKNIPLHLFVFDIDFFKQINDTYGHGIGDEVLKSFTQLALKSVTKISCFARLGGDEFIMIITGVSHEEARSTIDKLRLHVHEAQLTSNPDVNVSISIGMATLEKSDTSISELITKADIQLYRAKESRNSLCSTS